MDVLLRVGDRAARGLELFFDLSSFGLDQVTSEMRRSAKAVNFGVIYGQSPFGLAKALDISKDEATEFIEAYFARYPGVKRFMDQTIAKARETQRTSTLLGRIRLLPDIASSNHIIRQAAERTAINTPIQGSAADLIKVAMIRVQDRLEKEFPSAKLLLQVHDELLLEVPEDHVDDVGAMVRDEMVGAMELNVPLAVPAPSSPPSASEKSKLSLDVWLPL